MRNIEGFGQTPVYFPENQKSPCQFLLNYATGQNDSISHLENTYQTPLAQQVSTRRMINRSRLWRTIIMSKQWDRIMQTAIKKLYKSDFHDARNHLERGLKLAEQINDADLRFETLTILARTCRELGDWEQAEAHTRRIIAMTISFFGERTREHALTLHTLAELYFDKGDFELAENTALASEDIISKAKPKECTNCNLMRLRPIVLLIELAVRRSDLVAARNWLQVYCNVMGRPAGNDDELMQIASRCAKNRRDYKEHWFRRLPADVGLR